MTDHDPSPRKPARGRRDFLKALGLPAALPVLPMALPILPVAALAAPAPVSSPAPRPLSPGTLFLNRAEALFIDAAIDLLIPADDLGPGALDSGVALFIDRQLASDWGNGGRWYMAGPFQTGTPQQGYQSAFTPARLIRAGIAETNRWTQSQWNAAFADLSPSLRLQALTGLDQGTAQLATVPAAAFFSLLLTLTREGFFADPIHGGNRDKVSWRLLGFPGVCGMYADVIESYRNRPWPHSPASIQDFI